MIDRDAYVEKVKANIDQWNAEIDKLQANAREAQADAKIQYEKQLADMRKQRDEALEKMKEVPGSDGRSTRPVAGMGRNALGRRDRFWPFHARRKSRCSYRGGSAFSDSGIVLLPTTACSTSAPCQEPTSRLGP